MLLSALFPTSPESDTSGSSLLIISGFIWIWLSLRSNASATALKPFVPNNELITQKINNDEFLYWVYEINSEIVGYLAIQKNFKELHILGIGVKEIFRNQSIAKKLTIELIDYFEESKYEQILLEVRVSNSVAINMYESFGFKHYGVREKYYKNEDANLFRLEKTYV